MVECTVLLPNPAKTMNCGGPFNIEKRNGCVVHLLWQARQIWLRAFPLGKRRNVGLVLCGSWQVAHSTYGRFRVDSSGVESIVSVRVNKYKSVFCRPILELGDFTHHTVPLPVPLYVLLLNPPLVVDLKSPSLLSVRISLNASLSLVLKNFLNINPLNLLGRAN